MSLLGMHLISAWRGEGGAGNEMPETVKTGKQGRVH